MSSLATDNQMKQCLDRTVSVAPMMDCTDRHYRFFARLLTQQTLLYSEMLTATAIIHGDRDFLLAFSKEEHAVALQLGGSDPDQLVLASKIGEDYGYDEININIGCPSDRVQAGRFGACLMKEPDLVVTCVQAMQQAVSLPVTVKTRLGVDNFDSYELLHAFVSKLADSGCITIILHARKAWLKGLSPKQNREVPPLKYEWVYQIKREFPALEIIINGGIKTLDETAAHLRHVDGVMLGRAAYHDPYILSEVDQRFHDSALPVITREEAVAKYWIYVERELSKGTPLRPLVRPLMGLFKGCPGAKQWRQSMGSADNSTKLALSKMVQNQRD